MTIYEIFFLVLIVIILLILIFQNRTSEKPTKSILKQSSPSQQTNVKKHVNFPDLRKSQMTSTIPVEKNQTPSNELSNIYLNSSIEWKSDIHDTPNIYEGRIQNPPLRFNI